jgi:hypothetical protein
LIYNEENRTVIENRRINLVCKVKGGNPPPEIEWYIGGGSNKQLLRIKYLAKSTETFLSTITSTLEIVVNSSFHNQPVECLATNKVTSFKKTVNILVSCNYRTHTHSNRNEKKSYYNLFFKIYH